MADVKPLKLRSQKAPATIVGAAELPIASVLVDTGVLHLSEPFDYLVPEKLSEKAIPGSLVKIPFNSTFTQGYVLERRASAEISKVRPIESVISALPLFTPKLHSLLEKVAFRYACNIWDVIRSAIPPRVAAVEKEFESTNPSHTSKGPIEHRYLALPRNSQAINLLIELAIMTSKNSQVLMIVPDERDIRRVEQALSQHSFIDYLVLGTHLEKSERYRAFLRSRFSNPRIILGTRSAIFTPLEANSTILILNDGEESFYEKRAPGWNVRDVALLRAQTSSLIFASYSPSLEVARLVDSGWLVQSKLADIHKADFFFAEGRDSHNSVIARNLKKGNVLLTLSAPGYIPAFSCHKCRNMALCECGGRLTISSNSAPICSICQKRNSDWRCTWCGEARPRAVRRGTERYAEEFGRAFPNVQIVISNSSHQVEELSEGRHLVIATNGCEPDAQYAAVVLLDGEILMNRAELRGDELARKHWSAAASQVGDSGEVFLSLPATHPTSRALSEWKMLELCIQETKERTEAHLPPGYRLAIIEGENNEVSKIAQAIEGKSDFISVLLVSIDVMNSRAIFRAPVERSSEFSDFFYDLMRYRSLKGAPPLRVRIDPFNI